MIESFVLSVLYFLKYASPAVILILIILAIYFSIKYPICPVPGCEELSDKILDNKKEAECSKHGKFYVNGFLKDNVKIVLYWNKDCLYCQEIIKFLENNHIPFDKKNTKRSKHRQQLEIKTHGHHMTPTIVLNNKILLSEVTVFQIRKKLKDLGVKGLELI